MPFTTPAMDLVTCGRVKRGLFSDSSSTFWGFICLVLRKKFAYLVHGDGGLHSRRHGVHPGAHSQEVHGLGLLSDGVLCVDPCHVHVTFLNSLGNNTQTHDDLGFL